MTKLQWAGVELALGLGVLAQDSLVQSYLASPTHGSVAKTLYDGVAGVEGAGSAGCKLRARTVVGLVSSVGTVTK